MIAVTRGVENKTARKFISFIDEFRKLNTEMQAGQIALFLHIVATPDLTIKELAQRAGLLEGGTITRNLDALSESRKVNNKGKVEMVPGHGLITLYEDPLDRRFKRVKPTNKGLRVYNTLVQLLGA
ncbi:MAG: MarR family transcriptional regulator [Mesorhizobium sp.]|uniref:MarR family winged helix-turn-helix transcriptional regulator n=1 Tax=Mesorhizobium sp. TaxID=1871066 RepID=UPI000FE55868|nr:MarR family winged helix-turn-helix transcriptional regulator [Mesorhizobium sp.]RWP18887.1 MAG: MarR family transcriptional regulator [Mesorhizobium sp.]